MYVCVCALVYLFVCMLIYIYMVTPPMNYRPSFCIVNAVSKQLFRQVRILYLSKTTENKLRFSRERVCQLIHVRREVRILYLSRTTEINLTFQQDMSVSSLRFDVSTKSTAALYPPNPKPTLPRENQKNHLLRHYAAKLQKDGFLVFFWFSLGKRWFWTGKPTFS